MRCELRCYWFLGIAAVLTGCTPAASVDGTHSKHAIATTSGTAATNGNSAMCVATIQPVRKTLIHRVEQPGEIHAFEQTPRIRK